jgi:hypothetical protein
MFLEWSALATEFTPRPNDLGVGLPSLARNSVFNTAVRLSVPEEVKGTSSSALLRFPPTPNRGSIPYPPTLVPALHRTDLPHNGGLHSSQQGASDGLDGSNQIAQNATHYLLDLVRAFFRRRVERFPMRLPAFCFRTFLPFGLSMPLSPRRRPCFGAPFTFAATVPSVDPIVRATLRSKSFSFPTRLPARFVFICCLLRNEITGYLLLLLDHERPITMKVGRLST